MAQPNGIDAATRGERQEASGCCAAVPVYKLADAFAQELAQCCKALAHPVRVQMLDILSRHGGDVCVCDLESQFTLSQPTISHHLKVLREAGLVDRQQRGPWLYYLIRPERLKQLRSYLDELVASAAEG